MPEHVSNPLLAIVPQGTASAVARSASATSPSSKVSSRDEPLFRSELARARQSGTHRDPADNRTSKANEPQRPTNKPANNDQAKSELDPDRDDDATSVIVDAAGQAQHEVEAVAVDSQTASTPPDATFVADSTQATSGVQGDGVEFAAADDAAVIAGELIPATNVDDASGQRDEGSLSIDAANETTGDQVTSPNDETDIENSATLSDELVRDGSSQVAISSQSNTIIKSDTSSSSESAALESVAIDGDAQPTEQPIQATERTHRRETQSLPTSSSEGVGDGDSATIAEFVETTANDRDNADDATDQQREKASKQDQQQSPSPSLTDRAGRFLRHSIDAEASQAPRLTSAEAARFVSRVSKAFQAAQDNGGVMKLRLSPPELGALRIELSVSNGALSARLETENPAARAILLDNLPALRERLAEQQIRIDQFDVDVNGGQHDGAPDWQGADDQRQASSRSTANRLSPTTGETPAEHREQHNTSTGDGRFNAVA